MSIEINKNSIEKLLKVPRKVAVLDEVFSTNDYIKDSEFDVVISKSQTGGRGTNNRKFFSPNGGIYLSLKLKPKIPADKISLITPFTAVALSKAIEKVCKIKPQIKWVNDIYISNKKVAGILCESTLSSDGIEVIVGVGVNVEAQNFPDFNLNTPTSLEEESGYEVDKNRLIAELLNEFDGFEDKILYSSFIPYYIDNFYLKDKPVRVESGDKVYEGIAIGVSGNLALLVNVNGERKEFISANVFILDNSLNKSHDN